MIRSGRDPPRDAAGGTGKFSRCNIFTRQSAREQAHGGEGLVRFARLLTGADVDAPCNFIDFTILPSGTSIGLHSHGDSEEEYYLILAGEGEMTAGGEQFSVGPGDLIRNPPGGRHGLRNAGPSDLHLFVFELAVSP